MIFNGIKIRFDCKNNQQYKTIGNFWEYMRSSYPNYILKGVGCNWHDDCMDYIIGDFSPSNHYDMDVITKKYPTAEYIEINLPDEGWRVYHCRLSELSKLYEEIYTDGVLKYEIEEMKLDGNCVISIIR